MLSRTLRVVMPVAAVVAISASLLAGAHAVPTVSLPMGEDYQNALLRSLGIPPEPANGVEEYATLGMSGLTGNAGMSKLAQLLMRGR